MCTKNHKCKIYDAKSDISEGRKRQIHNYIQRLQHTLSITDRTTRQEINKDVEVTNKTNKI